MNRSVPAVLCSLALSLCFLSCSDDDDIIVPEEPTEEVPAEEETPPEESEKVPEVGFTTEETEFFLRVGDTLTLAAGNANESEYEEEWSLNDLVVSTTGELEFIPEETGEYTLRYKAFNSAGDFEKEFRIEVAIRLRPITENGSSYVTELFEFLPAPGQFINKNPGNMESAEGIVGKKGLVSLGGWGGTIVLGFDHTVINKEDTGDIMIYGNAMPNFAEPGVVWVMQDENGNGLPDDTWYEIKGSAHGMEGTIRNYEVTYFRPGDASESVPWEDNQGNSGVIATNAFHKQPYYPEWIEADSYTLKGTLLSSVNIDMSNPSYITSTPFEYGYADNTMGGDAIDIADAIDAAGNTVSLEGIDFIKIQTGIQANMGWLGELSTEVAGVADLGITN
ncbi:cell surface protein [Sinomicrobium sp. M5D2P9]